MLWVGSQREFGIAGRGTRLESFLVVAARPGDNMLGTDFILRSLVADGIGHLFLVPGGLVDPFMPAIGRVPELMPVVAAQEGGATYMADGYARASGKFGACLCIGGPGVTNTVTALSAAYTDESPVLVITGEVANYIEGLGFSRMPAQEPMMTA